MAMKAKNQKIKWQDDISNEEMLKTAEAPKFCR
jgi:hypothetical protein